MPTIDGQTLPVLISSLALAHKLAGDSPEYQAEPRILIEGNGYLKGSKVLKTSPLSKEDADHIIKVLTAPGSYGDRGMGARCFFPGFAFSFGTGEESVHVQVCLECSWVVFDSSSGSQSCVPSTKGEIQLKAIYERVVA